MRYVGSYNLLKWAGELKFWRIAIVVLLCCLIGSPAYTQRQSKLSEPSCREFAQDFYDWYVPKVSVGDKDWHFALDQRGEAFAASLARALRNSDIEAKVDGDPVLDFDPIINSQDPGDRYTVRSVTISHNRCFARVYGLWRKPTTDSGQILNVVAEMAIEKGHWAFVNFDYPRSGVVPAVSLLRILGSHYKRRPAQQK